MKKTISILLLVTLFGCNNTKENKVHNEEVLEKYFSVHISFKSNQPDKVNVSLRNIVIDEFQNKSVIFQESIIASNDFDELKVVFGANDKASNFAINLGIENEKLFEIKSIKLAYGAKEVFIENTADFKKYFALNKYVNLEAGSIIKLNTLRINNQLNPVIYAKSQLLNRLFEED